MNVLDLSGFPSSKQVIFKTNRDTIQAIFHYSNDHKFIEKIEITDSTIGKKIHSVTYCDITDAIEIHYFRNTTDPFVSGTYSLTNCRLNALRILVLDYDNSETPKTCASTNSNMGIPGTSKGSIIVGNP